MHDPTDDLDQQRFDTDSDAAAQRAEPDRCQLTDLLVDQCAHCTGAQSIEDQVAAEHAALAGQPGWIEAQYPGACCRCGEPIAVGDLIRRDPCSPAGWMGACCPRPEGTS